MTTSKHNSFKGTVFQIKEKTSIMSVLFKSYIHFCLSYIWDYYYRSGVPVNWVEKSGTSCSYQLHFISALCQLGLSVVLRYGYSIRDSSCEGQSVLDFVQQVPPYNHHWERSDFQYLKFNELTEFPRISERHFDVPVYILKLNSSEILLEMAASDVVSDL